MRLHIKNARLVDPASGRDGSGDVFAVDGKISPEGGKADRVIDAKGLVVAPGLIDLSARLREPGYEYKATLESEMDAAVAGGLPAGHRSAARRARVGRHAAPARQGAFACARLPDRSADGEAGW
jgi:imidazolonepropionase-like amidohydrolase